ncbi:hypothetical protein NHQ30_000758 [Ciborinia camelliae]|nr:hypothetical protein NHQ30_000758 [Ciborinia camelliae]
MRVYQYGCRIRILRVATKKWPVQKTRQLATAASLHVERYDISCGISGQITVDFVDPSVVYKKSLTSIAVHDALQAYTWLLDSYLPSLSPQAKPLDSPPADLDYPPSLSPQAKPLDSPDLDTHPKPIQRPLLIYGSYLGGTLATSLALTESFDSSSLATKIHSLIVHNGIFDWTPISTTPDPSKSPSPIPSLTRLSSPELYAHSPWTTLTLHALKPNPTASPPYPESPPPDLRDSSEMPPEEEKEEKEEKEEQEEQEEQKYEPLKKSRQSSLIFPPQKSTLQIPRSLFTYSSSSSSSPVEKEDKKTKDSNIDININIFQTQAKELTKLMRRSITMQELRERAMWDDNCDADGIAGARVACLEFSDGAGLEGIKERVTRDWIEEGGL